MSEEQEQKESQSKQVPIYAPTPMVQWVPIPSYYPCPYQWFYPFTPIQPSDFSPKPKTEIISRTVEHIRDPIKRMLRDQNIIGTGTRRKGNSPKTKENLLTSWFRFYLKVTKFAKPRRHINVIADEIIAIHDQDPARFQFEINSLAQANLVKIENVLRIKKEDCQHFGPSCNCETVYADLITAIPKEIEKNANNNMRKFQARFKPLND